MDEIAPVLYNSEVRGMVAKTIIEVLRGFSMANFGNPNVGETIEENLIVAALVVGQSENRLMCASDIAAYIGLPRPTVVRKLRTVGMSRMLGKTKQGNRLCYYIKDPNSDKSMDLIRKVMIAIRQCCSDLSKMDTQKLDRKTGSN